ncbi:MAG TPA: rod shape-determining protein RodA [Chloroflexota bacterium]|nr:rod shape-determining protein RodA [Chloroflexota bacterium]
MDTRVWRYFDPLLFLVMVLLIAYGVAMIYSATFQRVGPSVDPLVYHQATYAALGLVLFLTLSGLDYHIFSSFAWTLYGFCCVALVVVLVIGRVLHGSQRWIEVGPWQFQPSELAKLCVILALSRFLSQNTENIHRPRVLALSLVIPAIPTALVLLQPDVGTATVYIVTWLSLLFLAGAPLRLFAGLFGAAAAAAPLAWSVMLPYQRDRIMVFVDPQSDPTNAGYNVIQALMAVGAGEFSGRGYLSGSQSQLHFLRVQYADFIFSVLAEELGFVGAFVLLVLFGILVFRGLRAARLSREAFGRLLACGIVVLLVYQVVVNIGMNVGLLPVTGIPLPMISYGGSSLLTIMGSLGILESIVMRHRKFGF